MTKQYIIWCLLILLIATIGYACGGKGTLNESRVKKESEESKDALQDFIRQQRESYEDRLKEKLTHTNQSLSKLQDVAKEQQHAVGTELQASIQTLQQQKSQLEAALAQLRQHTDQLYEQSDQLYQQYRQNQEVILNNLDSVTKQYDYLIEQKTD